MLPRMKVHFPALGKVSVAGVSFAPFDMLWRCLADVLCGSSIISYFSLTSKDRIKCLYDPQRHI